MPTAVLPDRGVVRIAGAQAREFLHNLFTNDIQSLADGTARFAALLSPQGKILADFLVVAGATGVEDAFLLDCPRSQIDDLTRRLRLYRLRAKIAIDPEPDAAVFAAWGADAESALAGPAFRDPRGPRLGWRAIAPAARESSRAEPSAYRAHRIGLAVPEGGCDFAYGDAYPHETRMDELNGLDFHKGCYVGQEVVSRMQHRGTARTRIVRVTIEGRAPEPFTEARAGESLIGRMGSSEGSLGLAMLRIDRLADALARREAIVCGEARLIPSEAAATL